MDKKEMFKFIKDNNVEMVDQALHTFVDEVRRIAPDATDLPVMYIEGGNAVVKAFQQAFIGALIVISLILAPVLRNAKDMFLVLMPLVLAGLLTCATIVILDMSFNLANIIVLPLLFGLGVDNGIHIVHRMRLSHVIDESLLRTSTARAIYFSGITTILSFSNLAFTSHKGVASMGLLLTTGVTFTLLCTLIVLPAYLHLEHQRNQLEPESQ